MMSPVNTGLALEFLICGLRGVTATAPVISKEEG
jgi:hypothetical protein